MLVSQRSAIVLSHVGRGGIHFNAPNQALDLACFKNTPKRVQVEIHS